MAKGKAAGGTIQVSAAPGQLKAEWRKAGHQAGQTAGVGVKAEAQTSPSIELEKCTFVLPVRTADETMLRSAAGYLEEKPLELGALLAGPAVPAGLAQLIPAEPPLLQPVTDGAADGRAQPGAITGCACGGGGCKHAAALREAAVSGWSADPALALTALDMAPDKLARAVFGAWAEEGAPEPGAPEEPAAVQRAAGGAAPRPAGAGPGIADWLSAAAAKGALHEPGPGFAEARGLPAPAADPGGGAAASVRSWLAGLLPSVPGAPDGLDMIVRRTAQRAAGQHEEAKSPGK